MTSKRSKNKTALTAVDFGDTKPNASATGRVPKSGQEITVHVARTNADPRVDASTLEPLGTSQLWSGPVVQLSKPANCDGPIKVDAFHCPAWFIVDGLNDRVALFCDFQPNSDTFKFRIAKIVVTHSGDDGITEVERLPIATIIDLAYKAAAVTAVYYPDDYHGPGHTLVDDNLVELPESKLTMRFPAGSCVPLGNGRQVTPKELRDAVRPGKDLYRHSRQPRGNDFLQVIADAYNRTSKHERDKHGQKIGRDKQAARLLQAAGHTDKNGLPFSASWVRENKSRAIAAGFKITEWRTTKGGKK